VVKLPNELFAVLLNQIEVRGDLRHYASDLKTVPDLCQVIPLLQVHPLVRLEESRYVEKVFDPPKNAVTYCLLFTIWVLLNRWVKNNHLVGEFHIQFEYLVYKLFSLSISDPSEKFSERFHDSVDLAVNDDIIDVFTVVDPLVACLVDFNDVRNFFEVLGYFLVVGLDLLMFVLHGSLLLLIVIIWLHCLLLILMLAQSVFDVNVKFAVDLVKTFFHCIDNNIDIKNNVFSLLHELQNRIRVFSLEFFNTGFECSIHLFNL